MHKKLNIVTLSTKSYINLINDYFLSTLPKEVKNMKILFLNDMDNVPKNSAVFFEIRKLEMVISEIKANMGNNLFFIDGDVTFAKNATFVEEVNSLLEKNDLLFQFNDLWYNFGVFAVSCNERTLEFFEHFVNVETPKAYGNTYLHDQHIVHALLGIFHPNAGFKFSVDKQFTELTHTSLPIRYFANHFENLKFPYDVPKDVVFLHATNTSSMGSRIALLKTFKAIYYDNVEKK